MGARPLRHISLFGRRCGEDSGRTTMSFFHACNSGVTAPAEPARQLQLMLPVSGLSKFQPISHMKVVDSIVYTLSALRVDARMGPWEKTPASKARTTPYSGAET